MERNISLIALFAALIAVLGLVPKLTLMSGIPITAQSLGVMLCGTVLGARRGMLAVLLFLLLVALGLPLLAGGRGGLGVFAGPTVGFLIGWVAGAYVIGLLTAKLTSLPLGLAAACAARYLRNSDVGQIGPGLAQRRGSDKPVVVVRHLHRRCFENIENSRAQADENPPVEAGGGVVFRSHFGSSYFSRDLVRQFLASRVSTASYESPGRLLRSSARSLRRFESRC